MRIERANHFRQTVAYRFLTTVKFHASRFLFSIWILIPWDPQLRILPVAPGASPPGGVGGNCGVLVRLAGWWGAAVWLRRLWSTCPQTDLQTRQAESMSRHTDSQIRKLESISCKCDLQNILFCLQTSYVCVAESGVRASRIANWFCNLLIPSFGFADWVGDRLIPEQSPAQQKNNTLVGLPLFCVGEPHPTNGAQPLPRNAHHTGRAHTRGSTPNAKHADPSLVLFWGGRPRFHAIG